MREGYRFYLVIESRMVRLTSFRAISGGGEICINRGGNMNKKEIYMNQRLFVFLEQHMIVNIISFFISTKQITSDGAKEKSIFINHFVYAV